MKDKKNRDGKFDDPEILARWEAAEIACQKIRHALAVGNDVLADRCLAGAKATLSRIGRDDQRFLDRPLTSIVDVRTANIFETHFGAFSIGDALNVPRHLLESAPNSGEKTLAKVINLIFAAVIKEMTRLEDVLAEQDFALKEVGQ